MKIFVRIPHNRPSGGIKVANQLVNLFREKGIDSFIVVNEEYHMANWMINPAPVITVESLIKACGANDIIIDNWIDQYTVETTKKLNAKTKIYYSQGSTFCKSRNLIGDDHLKMGSIYTHYWTVSTDAKKILESNYPKTGRWHLVHPYFEHDTIAYFRENVKQRKNAILCLSRKGKSFILFIRFALKGKIRIDVISKSFTEIEIYRLMAKYNFFLSTAIGISSQYLKNIARVLAGKSTLRIINPSREGFPLPPVEAALCGSIVIGFSMGGGLEWMSPSTCFLARDKSYISLLKKIKEAFSASSEHLNTLRENAIKSLYKFNKENTWQQIAVFLKREGIE